MKAESGALDRSQWSCVGTGSPQEWLEPGEAMLGFWEQSEKLAENREDIGEEEGQAREGFKQTDPFL